MQYIADFEYYAPGAGGRGLSITFVAKDAGEAIDAAFRFYANRARIDDLFGQLLALKISEFAPDVIAEDGSYTLPRSLPVFDWKIDGGYTREQQRTRWVEKVERYKAGQGTTPDIVEDVRRLFESTASKLVGADYALGFTEALDMVSNRLNGARAGG